jgi:hypothetical protein
MARKKKPVAEPRHCDEYIDDPSAPEVLRKFLDRARAPAHGLLLPDPFPILFADHEGQTYRVTMASRLGDVGITKNLDKDSGYELRVPVEVLTNFRDKP